MKTPLTPPSGSEPGSREAAAVADAYIGAPVAYGVPSAGPPTARVVPAEVMSRGAHAAPSGDAFQTLGGGLIPCSDAECRRLDADHCARACCAACFPFCFLGLSMNRAGRPAAQSCAVCALPLLGHVCLGTGDALLLLAQVKGGTAAAVPMGLALGSWCGLAVASLATFSLAGKLVNDLNVEWGGESNVFKYTASMCLVPRCFALEVSRAVDARHAGTVFGAPDALEMERLR